MLTLINVLEADPGPKANSARQYARELWLRYDEALSQQPAQRVAVGERADWFAGDVDCDGNELVTLRADTLRSLHKRACEVVHHEPDCEHDGRGDNHCTCDAVPFLRDLEKETKR